MKNENVQVSTFNADRLKKVDKNSKISKKSLGKGKILLTIDRVLGGAAAVFEILRALPGFEYLKAIETGRLTTWFNVTVGTYTATDPTNVNSVLAAIEKSRTGIGMIFSAIVEFVIEHPTVTILGATTCLTILAVPFKMLANKIRSMKVEESYTKAK